MPTSTRQAQTVCSWIRDLGQENLDILEVGCGTGWLCERLAQFGNVTGIDFAGDVLAGARSRLPAVRFVAGDFMAVPVPPASTDIVVTLEVLSHVPDQGMFIQKIASTLRQGGYLMIGTQNKFAFERNSSVQAREYGQIRRWVTPRQLRDLLAPFFAVEQLITVVPGGDLGVLRLVNSPKLNALMSNFVSQSTLDRWKERAGLGLMIMALAKRT